MWMSYAIRSAPDVSTTAVPELLPDTFTAVTEDDSHHSFYLTAAVRKSMARLQPREDFHTLQARQGLQFQVWAFTIRVEQVKQVTASLEVRGCANCRDFHFER